MEAWWISYRFLEVSRAFKSHVAGRKIEFSWFNRDNNRLLFGFAHHWQSNEWLSSEKALRETQTLRAGCSKAEPKNFAPPQTPSRGAGQPKFDQLEMVTTFTTDPVWWRSMHAISSYRDKRPTLTHKHTDRTDYDTLRC